MSKKPRVAILSTWEEVCGIAHFTKGIVDGLSEHYDVTVLPTPRMILGNAKDAAERAAADNYCSFLAKQVADFDHVNIQFEPGILASDMMIAMKRFEIITEHAQSLSITWHYLGRRQKTPRSEHFRLWANFQFRRSFALKRSEKYLNDSWDYLFDTISAMHIPVSHITHTKRDQHLAKAIFNGDTFAKEESPHDKLNSGQEKPKEQEESKNDIYELYNYSSGGGSSIKDSYPRGKADKIPHFIPLGYRRLIRQWSPKSKAPQPIGSTPLTYFSEKAKSEFIDKLADSNLRNVLPKPKSNDTRYVGVFGFFSGYKGFETAIDAVDSLPPNYELLMFSSVHESTLRIESRRDEYLGELYDHLKKRDRAIRGRNAKKSIQKSKLLARLDGKKGASSKEVKELMDKTFEKKDALSDRVHFLGAVSDDDLVLGMMLCDAILFPYINSPHTASGPTAQAVELDRRIFASRNIQFVELAKFHEGHFEFCDIGNSIEYAQKIPRMTQDRTDRMVHGYRVVDYPPRVRKNNMARAIELYQAAIER